MFILFLDVFSDLVTGAKAVQRFVGVDPSSGLNLPQPSLVTEESPMLPAVCHDCQPSILCRVGWSRSCPVYLRSAGSCVLREALKALGVVDAQRNPRFTKAHSSCNIEI